MDKKLVNIFVVEILLCIEHFALSQADMRTTNGDPTGAILALTMLFTLMTDHKPDGLAVALTYHTLLRHERVETYKAGRARTPDDLLEQLPR